MFWVFEEAAEVPVRGELKHKKMSSIYQNQTVSLSFWFQQKPVSTLSINMQAYGDVHFVPIAVI